jgi:hypothetical protein
MLKKTFATAFLFFSITMISFAQDINGKWTGKVMDQFDVAYNFKADGEKLTGSTTGPDGNEVVIKEGTIKGNDVAFTINIMDNDTKINGKLDGEVLTLKFSIMGNDVELVLKKVVK